LALFGRRSPERAESLVVAGIQKPAQELTIALQRLALLFDDLVGAGERDNLDPVAITFSNFAIALSAGLLVRARYLSRMSCTRRSVWPVIETISGSVQPASANIVTVVPRMSWK
jgi:hypothetical protein